MAEVSKEALLAENERCIRLLKQIAGGARLTPWELAFVARMTESDIGLLRQGDRDVVQKMAEKYEIQG